MFLSIVQRKVLTPHDFTDVDEVERRLLDFERYYEEARVKDLADLMKRLAETEALRQAA
jgi:hypothetical protein